jgi:dihydroxy-acid dehydratase
MKGIKELNKFSKVITQDKSQGASQAMLYALGLKKKDLNNPLIGIASMGYDGNPCNSHLNYKADVIKQEINKNNMVGLVFNTIGVSDGISMGTSGMKWSLPSREIIADSIETVMNAQWYDGCISVPGCDKNMPACIMAMARYNRPSIMVYGGSTNPGKLNDKKIDIVSGFQAYSQYKTNEITDLERESIIQNCCPGVGSCGGMYTANTMASISEVMGLTLPNSSSNPVLSFQKMEEIHNVPKYMINLLENNIKPRDIVTKTSIDNAIKIGIMLGGSTNLVIHMLAIADSFNIKLDLDYFNNFNNLPVIANLKPIGEYLMNDVHTIGGMSSIIRYLIEYNVLDGDVMTVTGNSLWDNVKDSKTLDFNQQNIIKPITEPITKSSHIKIMFGNLAPEGCVSKISGKEGTMFRGMAKVYNNEEDFLKDLDDDKIKPGTVIVLRYLGPKGGPGMPEMLKPTSSLVGSGLEKDVALITDGRFSGGSHGFIIGHISPEAFDRGPISIVEDGDMIIIDSNLNTINLLVSEDDVNKRFSELKIPDINSISNSFPSYLQKYQKLVSCASKGCIT